MKILCITPHNKFDYLTSSIIEGLKENNHEIYCTDYGNGVEKVYTDEQILTLSESFDYIFAMSSKCIYNGVPSPKYYLIDKLNGWHKTVYLDGSEYNFTGFNNLTTETLHPIFLKKCKWYFKRECTEEHLNKGIYPLPFASQKSYFKYNFFNENKSIDILCSWGGNQYTGLRKECTKIVNKLKNEGYSVETSHQNDYYKSINTSWIVLDAYGGGQCNARTFEILPNYALPCIQKWTIKMPNPFINKLNVLEYENETELYSILKTFLNDKLKIKEMIENGYDLINRYHTTKARVDYIFKHISKNEIVEGVF